MVKDNLLNVLIKSKTPYYTSSYLFDLFKDYKSPQHKIQLLQANGDLIRIKQGLYILGEKYDKPFLKNVLSGMIFGPSAISFEAALSEHSLIPERVEAVTCICFKRNKTFKTPVGLFTYKYIHKNIYSIGIEYKETDLGNYFLATPEKALCDLAYSKELKTPEIAYEYVNSYLRIDEEAINKLNLSLLKRISKLYNKKSISNLFESIKQRKLNGHSY